ncbi:unnamed protein product [Protopolystoma xenopodis]|uniref:Uncharacterized protein n=1 Tax=Protopolystoma xenopodis TaxID=117903 RepID=A0A3S5CLI8_9PLAT|nr:unnamed protein product [Protopolystoma xenopodis]
MNICRSLSSRPFTAIKRNIQDNLAGQNSVPVAVVPGIKYHYPGNSLNQSGVAISAVHSNSGFNVESINQVDGGFINPILVRHDSGLSGEEDTITASAYNVYQNDLVSTNQSNAGPYQPRYLPAQRGPQAQTVSGGTKWEARQTTAATTTGQLQANSTGRMGPEIVLPQGDLSGGFMRSSPAGPDEHIIVNLSELPPGLLGVGESAEGGLRVGRTGRGHGAMSGISSVSGRTAIQGATLSFHDIVYEVKVKKMPWSKPVHKTVLNGVR